MKARGKVTIVEAAATGDVSVLAGIGIGLMVYAFAPPELQRLIARRVRMSRPRPPAPAVDLSAKHPGAIDV